MELRKGYKMTEVGVIPEDWDVKNLSEVTILMTNGFVGTVKSFYSESDSDVLYIQGYNVEENGFNFNGIKYISKEFHKQHSKSSLQEGDLLTIQTGDVGLTTIVPEELVGSNCHALIISRFKKKNINSKFYSYYFNSFVGRSRLKSIETGTTMKHINVGDLLQFTVPLPSTLSEQTAIVTALSDADALNNSLEKLIEKKRAIKQGAMQQLLKPKKGWVVKTLGEIANIQRGASPRPIDSPVWFDDNSDFGWVRISDVTKSIKYLKETTQKLSEEGVKNSRPVNGGELIMSICATIGRPILTTFNVCIHDGFVVFYKPIVDKEYLYYYLTFIEKEWSKAGQTGSQMNLNTNIIQTRYFSFPENIEDQKNIAAALSAMDEEIFLLEKNLNKYKLIKQGMMQELLTGKTRLL
jgi:type I restriction enzyme S subunit